MHAVVGAIFGIGGAIFGPTLLFPALAIGALFCLSKGEIIGASLAGSGALAVLALTASAIVGGHLLDGGALANMTFESLKSGFNYESYIWAASGITAVIGAVNGFSVGLGKLFDSDNQWGLS